MRHSEANNAFQWFKARDGTSISGLHTDSPINEGFTHKDISCFSVYFAIASHHK